MEHMITEMSSCYYANKLVSYCSHNENMKIKQPAHQVRGDGTNSSAYKSFKLYTSEVVTAAFVPGRGALLGAEAVSAEEDGEEEDEMGADFADTHRSFPDLTWVPNKGNTARCHKELWDRQLSSIGMRSWGPASQRMRSTTS